MRRDYPRDVAGSIIGAALACVVLVICVQVVVAIIEPLVPWLALAILTAAGAVAWRRWTYW